MKSIGASGDSDQPRADANLVEPAWQVQIIPSRRVKPASRAQLTACRYSELVRRREMAGNSWARCAGRYWAMMLTQVEGDSSSATHLTNLSVPEMFSGSTLSEVLFLYLSFVVSLSL